MELWRPGFAPAATAAAAAAATAISPEFTNKSEGPVLKWDVGSDLHVTATFVIADVPIASLEFMFLDNEIELVGGEHVGTAHTFGAA